ncbi:MULTISPECIES: transposase [unclassified Paraburkholderia]|uniref:Transposase n=1 Tax=Paraburkholderia guartelaensis TaxID=2546446 RepID=A0A4R5L1E1_9BURK|nr:MULTISPECIES: transposase [unclassified Paraburkholderia]TDG02109.1 hypothetical protein E1N52_41535 [Paraburkholderia guartelaensis]
MVVESLFGPQTRGPAVRASPVCGLNAILHVLTKKCRWVHLPQHLGYPSHIAVRHNSRRWQQKGTMDVVVAALAQHGRVLRPATPQNEIGVDVALGGKDKTVITPRYDNDFAEHRVVLQEDQSGKTESG